MRTLHIRLLGQFQMSYGMKPVVGVATSRPQSVLTYLLLHRQALQPRRHVATTLWPTSTESQARTNLRKHLYYLRRTLPDIDQFLYVDGNSVQWRPDAPFTLDIAEFEHEVDAARQAETGGNFQAVQAALEKAIEHYQGDLLPGCYDDWILAPRERLSRMYIRAVDQLAQLLEAQRDYATALRYAQRLRRHDPLRETAYRRLMRLHALNGDRAKALQAYHRCATLLERELGVEPSETTQAAYESLLIAKHETASRPHRRAVRAAAAPLVGRERAWTQLQAAWRTAARQGPHFALVSGEAGIGKTRLAEELLGWAERQGIATATTRCFAVEGPLAYAPVIGWLRTGTLQSALAKIGEVWLTELARLLPELLSQRPALPHPEPLTESWRRQRLFEAITRAVLAASRPLLLFIDDLQWCDDETLAWLHYLLRFDPQARLLIVGTVRSEEVMDDRPLLSLLTELRGSKQLTESDLVRLNEAESATLARHVTGRELDADEKANLYRETEGNPLFVVESLRVEQSDLRSLYSHLESSDAFQGIPLSAVPSSLPPKVEAVIERRLKQLSAGGRALADVAAVVGREFTFDVVAQASDWDNSAVVAALDELWQRRIVREQEGDVYDFSHDKIREAVYSRLSPARRRHLHGRVAAALEAVSKKRPVEMASDLARHYTAAGETRKAVSYRLAAGKRALTLAAHQEASRHLRQGLALLKMLPETADRDQTELAFRMALGSVLVPQKGYTAPEVREVYDQAADLVHRLGEESRLVPVLYGLGQYYTLRGEWKSTRALAERSLHLAQQTQYPDDLLLAHVLLGFALSYMGEPVRAVEHLRQSLKQYDQQPASPIAGTDLGVLCRCHLALTLWSLGYPEQSLAEMDEALRLAHDLCHPYSLAAALTHAGGLSMLRQEPQRTQAYQDEASALCVEYEFPYWQAYSRVLQGWALSQQGKVAEGLTEAQRGLEAFTALGANTTPYTYPLLAQIHAGAGNVANGLRAADEAVTAATDTGLRCLKSMALRVKGDLLWLGDATPDKVEACYQRAIDVARAQKTKSFELQATMALCRMWQQHGRQAEARELLTNIYNWFSEGFDTPDLKAATALLAALA